MNETNLKENEEIYQVVCWISYLLLPTYNLVLISFFYGSFLFIVAQLEVEQTPFTEDPRCKLPFTENSRTYNSMFCVLLLSVLLLRILGPITLCMLSWDLQFHACYLFNDDPRQIRQI